MSTGETDPIRIRRARIARLVEIGQRVGYGLFGVAIIGFVAGFIVGFDDTYVTVVVVSLLAGSVVLAPAIVFGYAVKAAEREDRQLGR